MKGKHAFLKITIGDTARFAVELSFENFYDDDWVAFGSFRLFLNGRAYGLKGRGTTYFYLIVVGLNALLEENILRKNFFLDYSAREVVRNYLLMHELTAEACAGKTFLGLDYKTLRQSFYDLREHTEMAFNDDSCVLMFRDESKVRLIGFKNPAGRKIRRLKSVILPREEFDGVIRKTVDTIFAERDRAIKNGTALINSE